MKRIWTLVLVLCLLLLLPIVTMAQVTVTPDRDTLQVGETLDFTVETDNPDAQTVTYLLKSGDKKVYSGKPVKVWRSAFRPRQEGTYTLQVTVQGKKKKDKETAECTFTVSGDAGPEEEWTEGLTVYSQKDGSWDKKPYRKSTLEEAGCAIFTLSHALQLLGHTGEDIQPANLAKTYAYCLVQGGTNNEKLITTAGGDYGFLSQPETIKETDRISALLKDGCLFSFSVANGHIALVAGLSEDGTKVRIVDSAPTATIERIKKTSMYLADGQGGWTEIKDLADVPGSHWYFETKGYNGMEYWMDLSYAAKRGVRLIRPLWLFEGAGDASAGGTPVKLVTPGYTTFMVEKNGEKTRINTSNLWWPHDTEKLSAACVTSKKTIWIKSDDGAKLKKAESCQLCRWSGRRTRRYGCARGTRLAGCRTTRWRCWKCLRRRRRLPPSA